MLPTSSSIYCIFDGGVHIDIVASIAPENTQKGTETAKEKGKNHNIKARERKRKDEREKGKTGSARTRIPAVVVPQDRLTLNPRVEQATQTTKTRTKHKVVAYLRVRRRVLPNTGCSRPGAVLSCLPSPSTAVSLIPPPPLRLCASRIRAPRRSELLFFSSTCHLAMNRSASSRITRYHLPAFFAA